MATSPAPHRPPHDPQPRPLTPGEGSLQDLNDRLHQLGVVGHLMVPGVLQLNRSRDVDRLALWREQGLGEAGGVDRAWLLKGWRPGCMEGVWRVQDWRSNTSTAGSRTWGAQRVPGWGMTQPVLGKFVPLIELPSLQPPTPSSASPAPHTGWQRCQRWAAQQTPGTARGLWSGQGHGSHRSKPASGPTWCPSPNQRGCGEVTAVSCIRPLQGGEVARSSSKGFHAHGHEGLG